MCIVDRIKNQVDGLRQVNQHRTKETVEWMNRKILRRPNHDQPKAVGIVPEINREIVHEIDQETVREPIQKTIVRKNGNVRETVPEKKRNINERKNQRIVIRKSPDDHNHPTVIARHRVQIR